MSASLAEVNSYLKNRPILFILIVLLIIAVASLIGGRPSKERLANKLN